MQRCVDRKWRCANCDVNVDGEGETPTHGDDDKRKCHDVRVDLLAVNEVEVSLLVVCMLIESTIILSRNCDCCSSIRRASACQSLFACSNRDKRTDDDDIDDNNNAQTVTARQCCLSRAPTLL